MTTATIDEQQSRAAESRFEWPLCYEAENFILSRTARRERLERLRANGSINDTQFEEFAANGAIGSHLENLQRKGGFKGFNQHAVSIIIAETDPRKQQAD